MMKNACAPGARRPLARSSLILVLLPLTLTLGCRRPPDQKGGDTAREDTTKGDGKNCQADRGWVESPSPPDGSSFTPKNGNCSFHQWAYQTFLWLASPGSGNQRVFEGFANPAALFLPDGPEGPYPGHEAAMAPVMLARVGKSRDTADSDDIFQAGPGSKVLVDQSGQVVYYSNHLNEVFWDFIDQRKLYTLEALKQAGATDFPIDSLELKASWRVAEKEGKTFIEQAEERFYTISAEIPRVTVDDQGRVIDHRDERIPARMALVGMHVTGIVKGHPEFIWATFEHVDNAPDCADIPATEAAGEPMVNPTTGHAWSFYDGTTPRTAANQFDVNDPLAVTNVCLVHPQGGGSDTNRQAVIALNEQVQAMQKGSVWANYELGGGVWTSGQVPLNNGAFSPTDVAAEARQLGSLDLANTSMETFTQNDNCFACHNGGAHEFVVDGKATEINAKSINLSHFVVTYQATRQADGNQ